MEIWEVQRIRLKILWIRNKIKAKLRNFVVVDWKHLNFEGKNHSFQRVHYNKRSCVNSQANLNSKRIKSLRNQNDFVGMEEKVLQQN